MIKVTLIKDGDVSMGIEIVVDGKAFFASADQKLWPGLRLGTFPPKDWNESFDREVLVEI